MHIVLKDQSDVMLPLWLLASGKLSLPAKVLLVLLDHHKDPETGECHANHRTLAKEMALSVATVKQAIDELVAVGLLQPSRGNRCRVSRHGR